MKHLLKLSLLLLALLLPATATAYDFEVDGIYYNIKNNNEAIVTCGEYSGEVNIPPTVTYNGTTYTVTSIGMSAFAGCNGLTSVTIPNSVITIEDNAFYNCSSLTSMDIGNSVSLICTDAFYGCTALTKVSITNLAAWCRIEFWSDGEGYCNPCSYAHHLYLNGEEITDLSIPDSVLEIGDDVFHGCSFITSITIPSSVTFIGGGAFSGCNGVKRLKWNAKNCNTNADFPTSIEQVTIGDGVEILPNYFLMGSKIANVEIPNSVTSIGYLAFSLCDGLTVVDIPNSVTSIGDEAFGGCSSLTSVTFPNSVFSIGIDAFTETPWYNNLKDGLVYTGLVAFTYKGSMPQGTSIIIDNGTLGIAGGAFIGCYGLSNVHLPNSLKVIGDYAFGSCLGLTSVTIPSTVEYIGFGAFDCCDALLDVYSYIKNPSHVLTSYAFHGDGGTELIFPRRTLHVPYGTLESYQSDANWSDCFGNIVEMEPGECNYFSMDDATVMHGDTIVIPVAMTNSESIIGFQTDIFLPEGLELLQEDGEYMIDPSGRMTRTHSIMSDDVSNGAVRVLCYSSNYKPFTGESGDDLYYLTVKVADDAEGDYTIQLKNTLLTTSDFVEISAPDVAATVNVKAYILGDANNSGTVTVTDVVVTSQYILEQNPEPFVFDAADVNADGSITVTDVSRIAWMVLNPTLTAPKRAPALWNNGDNMSGEGISLSVGETRTVSISLDNEMDYTAFQLDLTLPDGLTAGNFRLTDRAASHAFDVNMLADGKTRALCYSPALTAIRGNEGALLTFDVTATGRVGGDILVDGIELVTTDCQTVRLAPFTIGMDNVTAVNEVAGGKTIARMDYFNLAGQQIERPANGVTLVVTTYTDGTRTITKVFMK